MLNNVEQCSHRIYYDDDIIYSANEYYIRTLWNSTSSTSIYGTKHCSSNCTADDAHASPPPQASNSPGYQNGVS